MFQVIFMSNKKGLEKNRTRWWSCLNFSNRGKPHKEFLVNITSFLYFLFICDKSKLNHSVCVIVHYNIYQNARGEKRTVNAEGITSMKIHPNNGKN